MPHKHFKVIVCRGPECGDRRGSKLIHTELGELVRRRGLGERVRMEWQSCFGRCTQGPNVLVREVGGDEPRFALAQAPGGRGRLTALYNRVTVANAARLIDGHVLGERIQRDLIERPAGLQSTPAEPAPPTSTVPAKLIPDGER